MQPLHVKPGARVETLLLAGSATDNDDAHAYRR
jgi:hypothetical protein